MTALLFEETFPGSSLDTSKWVWTPASGVTLTISDGICTIYRPNDAELSYLETVDSFTNVGMLSIQVRQKVYGSDISRYYYHSIYFGDDPWSSVGFVDFSGYESALATLSKRVPDRTHAATDSGEGYIIPDPPLNTWWETDFLVPRQSQLAHQYDSDPIEEADSYLGVDYGNVGFRIHVPSDKFGDTATTEIDYIRVYGTASTYPSDVRMTRTPAGSGTYPNGVQFTKTPGSAGTYASGVRYSGRRD